MSKALVLYSPAASAFSRIVTEGATEANRNEAVEAGVSFMDIARAAELSREVGE